MKNLGRMESPVGYCKADLRNVSGGRRSALDMAASDVQGEEHVVVQIRQKDHSAFTTQIFFRNACVVELLIQEANDISGLKGVDRSSWQVRITGGVDSAPVSAKSFHCKCAKTKT